VPDLRRDREVQDDGPEARQALREMRLGLDKAHVAEVETKLDAAEKAANARP